MSINTVIRLMSYGLVLLVSSLATSSIHAETTLVAVASNFKPAMSQLIRDFEIRHGDTVTPVYASSGKLFAQIVNGAPYHLFLSADAARPEQLAALGKARRDTQFTYAIGKLVLWQPTHNSGQTLEGLLLDTDYRFVAIANPKLAPYGMAAQQVLEKIGLWEKLQSQLVRGENIAQAMHYVASGNADLGLVALSQTMLLPAQKMGTIIPVPDNWYSPILQDAIVITANDTVTAFVAYLQSEAAQTIIKTSGYAVP